MVSRSLLHAPCVWPLSSGPSSSVQRSALRSRDSELYRSASEAVSSQMITSEGSTELLEAFLRAAQVLDPPGGLRRLEDWVASDEAVLQLLRQV